jgi:hypothetical protein
VEGTVGARTHLVAEGGAARTAALQRLSGGRAVHGFPPGRLGAKARSRSTRLAARRSTTTSCSPGWASWAGTTPTSCSARSGISAHPPRWRS